MKIAEVRVSGCRCETVRLEPVPRGIVGAVVSIAYEDPAWDSLRKTVVFRGAVTKDVLDAGNEVVIPAETVSRAGVTLYMGVYGADAENHVVIPTVWTELGTVQGAATPSGDASTDPTPPVWAQIQGMVGDLDALDTEVKSNLVAAVNEALAKSGNAVDAETVRKIVEDCLKTNPPKDGSDGKDGITPTIGENGNWYLGDTDTGKPSRGTDGAVPSIQIGTVTTLPAGSDATATMGGTAENPLLDLGIPKGADGQKGDTGSVDLSLGVASAVVGQTVRIKAVDADGRPTAWAAEKWEKIAEIIIPDDAEETDALTIDKDLSGQPFALLKARLCGKFPKYTGTSTIPTNSFAMLNGRAEECPRPTAYTGLWSKVKTASCTGSVYEVDVSGVQMVEGVLRAPAGGWSDDTDKDYNTYGSTSSVYSRYYTDSLWAKPITSIGGTGMLIYPGCRFVLYGVRA